MMRENSELIVEWRCRKEIDGLPQHPRALAAAYKYTVEAGEDSDERMLQSVLAQEEE